MGVVVATVSNAGYKGETITNPSGTEKGTKHFIPDASKKGGAKGDLTVRAMKGGRVHGKRTVIENTSGRNVRGDGSAFPNNASKGAGHYPQD